MKLPTINRSVSAAALVRALLFVRSSRIRPLSSSHRERLTLSRLAGGLMLLILLYCTSDVITKSALLLLKVLSFIRLVVGIMKKM